ncbi:MAG: hypothetical protein ABI193_01365 [Minicystis sp.]
MIWTIEWSFLAEHRDLQTIHWRTATRLCSAILQLSETGKGQLERITEDDPRRFRLRVPGAEAQLFVDMRARSLHVVRIFPRER